MYKHLDGNLFADFELLFGYCVQSNRQENFAVGTLSEDSQR